MLTLGSLFDGLGGWQIAATRNDIKPIWSSEIELLPLAVTAQRFPNTEQLGDITKIDGSKITPVDIITMGSPCQNLSIAGNRKGLKGEQSSLFMHGIRIIREMQKATAGRYPRFVVWENVSGAFNSNRGIDFKTVLEEITETEIPMPSSKKWTSAGLVRSGKCNVAWRILDAQYWGVAQRRKRIFLIADFTAIGRRADKILFESKGLQGDITPSENEGKAVAAIAKTSTYKTVTAYDMTHADDVIRTYKNNIIGTLQARMGTGGNQVPIIHAHDFVRKLTPLECERLQGLPDNWTLIDDKSCSDSARYKAIGNGMAQPCADFVMKNIKKWSE
jgi:DNA (cytosine-5)-methyltransferase 1|nr:MAG TPA: Cytosine specific methyltransferase [Caudoviricetes sp.]